MFRWVYIIEGCFSILITFAVWYGLPTNPAESWFLNDEEKNMMRIRYAQRREYMGSEEFDWKEVKAAFQDPKLYLRSVLFVCWSQLVLSLTAVASNFVKISCYMVSRPSYPAYCTLQDTIHLQVIG